MLANKFKPPVCLERPIAGLLQLSQVYNPMGIWPPADLSEETLQNWPCAEHLQHLLDLIHLPALIHVLADYHIGKYLIYQAGRDGFQTAVIIRRLCTEAASQETDEFCQFLRECSCTRCQEDLRWLETRSAPPRPGPCKTTEVKAKVLHDSYKNCTSTYMAQCCSFASAELEVGYWVPYFAAIVAELGTGNECVHAVLWCACTCDSNWSQRDWEADNQMSLPTCPAHG